MIESHFLPNSLSFERFDYPCHFEKELEIQIEEVDKKLVDGIGLQNTLFNIEMKVDQTNGKIWIIEINSRLSLQPEKGRRLSAYPQDPYTYRYAIVNIPGASKEDILNKRDELERNLKFLLQPISI